MVGTASNMVDGLRMEAEKGPRMVFHDWKKGSVCNVPMTEQVTVPSVENTHGPRRCVLRFVVLKANQKSTPPPF